MCVSRSRILFSLAQHLICRKRIVWVYLQLLLFLVPLLVFLLLLFFLFLLLLQKEKKKKKRKSRRSTDSDRNTHARITIFQVALCIIALIGATHGVTVSTSASPACYQCYCAGSSFAWGLNLRDLVCDIFWSSSPGIFSGYSGFLPSPIG